MIEESKSEGIFVVEGEEGLNINENWINKNSDGIVLFNSKGRIFKNVFKQNQNAGVVTLGVTTARLTDNEIEGIYRETEGSGSIGILIKDPSDPELFENRISNNRLEVEIESKKNRRKMYKKIKEGENRIQGNFERQGRVCAMF